MSPVAGELAATLELRGKAQFLAGLRDVSKGVRTMTTAVKESGTTADSVDRSMAKVYSRQHISGLGSLGGAFAGVRSQIAGTLGLLVGAGGLVAGLKQSVSLASQLQTRNTQLAVASGATAANLPGLRAQQTRYASRGYDANSVAQAQYHIESAYGGRITNRAAGSILDNSGRLYALGGGKLSGTDPVTTANLLTTLLRADQSLRNNSTGASALLNATHVAGNMTVANLIASLGTGAPATLAAMGISFQSLAPALAVAGDTRGGDQVASFARLLQTPIMKAFNPTNPSLDAQQALHIRPGELQNDLRSPNGLVAMINDLAAHLAPFGKNAQDKYVGQMFGGSRGSAPIFTLLGNRAMLNSKVGQIAAADNVGTYLADSNQSMHTPAWGWQTVRNTFTNDETGFGRRLLPLGSKLGLAGGDLLTGNRGKVGADLGLSAAGAAALTSELNNLVAIGHDTDRIFHDDLVPTFETVAKLGGGAFALGTTLLKDTLGFMAEHPTEIKSVLDTMLALYGVKKVGQGLSALSNVPGMLGARVGATSGATQATWTRLTNPVDAYQTALAKASKAELKANKGMAATAASAEQASAKVTKAQAATAAGAEQAAGRMTSSGLGASIGAITGALAGYTAGRSANSTGSAETGGLVAALSGAAVGFSVGGPLGAAVGGFAGVAATAVGYFTRMSGAARASAAANSALGLSLRPGLISDQGSVGAASLSAINGYESSSPGANAAFVAAGLTNKDITAALSGKYDAKIRAVLGAQSGPGVLAAKYLTVIAGQFSTIAQQDLNLAKLQGQALKPWVTTIAASEAIATGLVNAATLLNLATGTNTPGNLTAILGGGSNTTPGMANLLGGPAVNSGLPNLLGGGAAAAPGRPSSSLPTISGYGGPVGRASGGDTRRGVMYEIGEFGPELIEFKDPAHVHTAQSSAAMLRNAGSGSGGRPIVIHVHPSPGMDERELAQKTAKALSDVAAYQ